MKIYLGVYFLRIDGIEVAPGYKLVKADTSHLAHEKLGAWIHGYLGELRQNKKLRNLELKGFSVEEPLQ